MTDLPELSAYVFSVFFKILEFSLRVFCAFSLLVLMEWVHHIQESFENRGASAWYEVHSYCCHVDSLGLVLALAMLLVLVALTAAVAAAVAFAVSPPSLSSSSFVVVAAVFAFVAVAAAVVVVSVCVVVAVGAVVFHRNSRSSRQSSPKFCL